MSAANLDARPTTQEKFKPQADSVREYRRLSQGEKITFTISRALRLIERLHLPRNLRHVEAVKSYFFALPNSLKNRASPSENPAGLDFRSAIEEEDHWTGIKPPMASAGVGRVRGPSDQEL